MINYNEELLTYAEASEMIFYAKVYSKYIHLLEGFTYPAATQLMFEARNN